MAAMNLPYISGPNEIPNEEYHRGEAYRDYISSTSLKHYQISPKYARWAQLHPEDKQTPAMMEGSVYHDLLASLTNFGDDREWGWVSFDKPPINLKTGRPYGEDSQAYQIELDFFRQQNPGKQICPPYMIQQAQNMVGELLTGSRELSPDIEHLIKIGKAEQSHFCEYQGGLFKYRTDLKTARKLVDWKKTRIELPKADQFQKVIVDYGYHISAAMYMFFEHEVTGVWKKFYWVAQENEPPYDFMILDSSEWTWEIGRGGEIVPKVGALEFIKLMEQHLICLEDQYWPGYSIFCQPDWKGHRIGLPEVPGWYNKQSSYSFYNKKTTKHHDTKQLDSGSESRIAV